MAVRPIDPRDKARLLKEFGVSLDNWNIILQHNRVGNVNGKVPSLRAKLGGTKTNAELAKEWGVSTRQASKIRNHRKPMLQKLTPQEES